MQGVGMPSSHAPRRMGFCCFVAGGFGIEKAFVLHGFPLLRGYVRTLAGVRTAGGIVVGHGAHRVRAGTACGGDGCAGRRDFRLGVSLCAAAFGLCLGIGFGSECGVGHL